MSNFSPVLAISTFKSIMHIYNVVSLYIFGFNTLSNTGSCAHENRKFTDNEAALEDWGIAEITIPKARYERDADDIWKFPLTLKNGTVINLNLKLTSGILANEDTPIWTATGANYDSDDVAYSRDTEMMSEIGKFSMYHDYENKAAFTVFHESETIRGVVGHYHIDDILPASFNNNRNSSKIHVFVQKSASSDDTVPDGLRPNGKPDIVYPELLIVLDIEYIEEDEYDSLEEVLAYWNKIDMLYSDMKSPEVKLNIAGIIIPTSQYTTPWVRKAELKNDGNISAEVAIKLLSSHFSNYTNEFPDDDYDFIVSLTSSPLQSNNGDIITGYASENGHCGQKNKPAVIINHFDSIYTTVAHELGHLLSAKHNQSSDACGDDNGTITSGRKQNNNALLFSPCSLEYFSNYFSHTVSVCLDNCPKTAKICNNTSLDVSSGSR